MSKHAPTPYKVQKYGSQEIYVIKKATKDVAYTAAYSKTGKADVAFIVKACNSHDRLVEALERTANALFQITKLAERDSYNASDLYDAHESFDSATGLLTELDQ